MRRALTTALVSSYGSGPRLFERPSGGAWSAPTPLPGEPQGVAGPVVDAAGNGALGIAWRVDAPRHYAGIAVAMRDPGGTLGEPTEIAGDDAGGVRHPALAIDPQGDALLAYNTATRQVHLSLAAGSPSPTATATARSRRRRSSTRRRSSAPAVAHRTRRHRRRRVDAWPPGLRRLGRRRRADRQGQAVRLAARCGPALVAAAGEGGAATLAWVGHRAAGKARSPRTRYVVRALGRTAGHAFAAIRTVADDH